VCTVIPGGVCKILLRTRWVETFGNANARNAGYRGRNSLDVIHTCLCELRCKCLATLAPRSLFSSWIARGYAGSWQHVLAACFRRIDATERVEEGMKTAREGTFLVPQKWNELQARHSRIGGLTDGAIGWPARRLTCRSWSPPQTQTSNSPHLLTSMASEPPCLLRNPCLKHPLQIALGRTIGVRKPRLVSGVLPSDIAHLFWRADEMLL